VALSHSALKMSLDVLPLVVLLLVLILILGTVVVAYVSLQLKNTSIKSVTYINLDRDEDRKASFLENYKKHSIAATIAPERFPAILATAVPPGAKVKLGEYGCSLSHAAVLGAIASGKKGDGWHMVCEDDCRGDFDALTAKYLKPVAVAMPWASVINLYCQRDRSPLLHFGTSTVAYLVKPKAAAIMQKIINENITEKPCDWALAQNPRLWLRTVKFSRAMQIADEDEFPSSIDALGQRDETPGLTPLARK
jgi:GR25 family glycosyltransferase involved in LPS biosynthesis